MTDLERTSLSMIMIYVIAYDVGIVHSGFWNDLLNGAMIGCALALPFQRTLFRMLDRYIGGATND